MTEELESEVQDLDRWLKQQLRPADDAVARVWGRIDPARRAAAGDRATPARPSFSRPAMLWAAGAAAAVVVLAVGGGLVVSRMQAPQPFATSVLPPQPAQGTAAGPGAAASGASQSQAGFAPVAAAAPAFYGGSCSEAPTVQLQGRGVTATGFAALSPDAATGSVVSLLVQGQGSDANAAAAAARSKASAVEAAVVQAGLAADQVQQFSFNVYAGVPNQASASVYLEARVSAAADVAKVITAAVQAGASSAYSNSQLPPDSATNADVKDAVTRATNQAKTMATATASAAGVHIAQLQTVVTQPPQACYGPSGVQRVVAVTVSYSIN
jgi:uncharacterized protein YggE